MQSNIFLAVWVIITLVLVGISYIRYGRVKRAMWRRLRSPHEGQELPAVSVLMAARNEAENLRQNLPLILRQQYPEYEVLVVNDGSEDGTRQVLEELKGEHSKLRILHQDAAGKKTALTRAVAHAEYDMLVFTDADCRPASEEWLRYMAGPLAKYKLVLGFGCLQGQKDFVGGLSQFETFQTAMHYYSAALKNKPYMGVGRNMAYRKEIFERQGGYEKHSDLPSGDDDLLVAGLGRVDSTVVFRKEAFTVSTAAKNLKRWWSQKRRHYSTSLRYPLSTQVLLGVEGLCQLLFYLLLPFMLRYYPQPAVFLFFMRYASVLVWGMPLARHFSSRAGFFLFPVWEMCWSVFTAIIHLQNLIFGTRKAW